MSNYETDPESIMDAERDSMHNEGVYEDVPAPYEYEDPFAEWFMPGYVTEMDYLNAQEADDYRDEFDIEF